MKKRILSLCLSLLMIFSVFSLTMTEVFAADTAIYFFLNQGAASTLYSSWDWYYRGSQLSWQTGAGRYFAGAAFPAGVTATLTPANSIKAQSKTAGVSDYYVSQFVLVNQSTWADTTTIAAGTGSAYSVANNSWLSTNNYELYPYNMSFDANGGTITNNGTAVNGSTATKSGQVVTFTNLNYNSPYSNRISKVPTATRVGYNMDGWAYGGSVIFSNGQSLNSNSGTYMLHTDGTLQASWSEITYRFLFDLNPPPGKTTNDITNQPTSTTKTVKMSSPTATVWSNAPSLSGYTFRGWALDENETNASRIYRYSADTSNGFPRNRTYTLTESDITNYATDDGNGNPTLYMKAIWIPDAQDFTLTYDSTNITAISPVTAAAGTSVTLPTPTVTDGSNFYGWNTSADGTGTMYQAGSSYTLNGNVTLYPITGYRVTLTSYGGSGTKIFYKKKGQALSLLTDRAQIASTYGITPAAVKSGNADQRYFIEWNTATNATGFGTGTSYYNSYTADAEATLYEICGYPVILNANGGTYASTGTDRREIYVLDYDPVSGNPIAGANYGNAGMGSELPTKSGCTMFSQNNKTTYLLLYSDNRICTTETTDEWLTIPPTGASLQWSQFKTGTTSHGITAPMFYAEWNPTVTYYPNGASGSSYSGDSLEFDSDGGALHVFKEYKTKNVTNSHLNYVHPNGYTFTGWNTAADGSGTSYAAGVNIGGARANSDPITLYAQWAAPASVNLSLAYDTSLFNSAFAQFLNAGGAYNVTWGDGYSGGSSRTYTNIPYNTNLNTYSTITPAQRLLTLLVDNNGHDLTFNHIQATDYYTGDYSETSNGSVVYPTSGTYPLTQTKTLWATNWRPILYTMTLDAGDGTMAGGMLEAGNRGATTGGTTVTNDTAVSSTSDSEKLVISNIKYNQRYDNFITMMPLASKTGYTNTGWIHEASGFTLPAGTAIPAGNVERWALHGDGTMVPIWVPNTYPVTYNLNAPSSDFGTVTQNVPANGTATYDAAFSLSSTVPAADGDWVFTGWNTAADGSGTSYSAGQNLGIWTSTSGLQLYAQWERKPHTLYFDSNGGTQTVGSPNYTIRNGQTYTSALSGVLPEATRTGYTFGGWWYGGNVFELTALNMGNQYSLTTDATMVAKWTPINYNLVYDGNSAQAGGGTVTNVPATQSIPYETSANLSNTRPSVPGYTFRGWATTPTGSVAYNPGESYTMSTQGATLYAVWEIDRYTVTYNANSAKAGGGTVTGMPSPSSVTQDYNTTFTVSSATPSATGYTFLGWSEDENATTATYTGSDTFTLTGNKTLYAVWEANDLSVTYLDGKDVNGNPVTGTGIPGATTIPYGSSGSLSSAVPTATGYTFAGWSVANDGTPDIQPGATWPQSGTMTADATLYATWTPVSCTLHYLNGKATNGDVVTGAANLPGNQTIAYMASDNLSSTVPTVAGYTFLGWSRDNDGTVDFAPGDSYQMQSATGDNVYAVWQANEYTVDYNSNGGSGTMASDTKVHARPVTVDTNTFTGPTLTLNYNANGTNVTLAKTSDSSQRPFTEWNTAADGSGTTYDGGDSYTTDASVTMYAQWGGDSYTLPTPTRPGYTFDGWYDAATGGNKIGNGGDSYTFAAGNTTETETVYAHWTADTYTVSYDSNGGSGTMADSTKTYDVDLTLSANTFTGPTLTLNYNANGTNVTLAKTSDSMARPFVEWNTAADGSGDDYADGGNYTANASADLYAQWGAGTFSSFPTPTRPGYTFDGWYTSATGGTLVTDYTFAAGNTSESDTVYAHWTADTYTVTYNSNGGSGNMTPSTKTHDVDLALSANTFAGPTVALTLDPGAGSIVTDYFTSTRDFVDWETATGTTYADGANYTTNGDAVLYAQWDAVDFTLGNPTPPTGYIFDGWYDASTGGTRVGGAGDTYTVPAGNTAENVTLYARYTPKTYNVIFRNDDTASQSVSITPATVNGLIRTDDGTVPNLISYAGMPYGEAYKDYITHTPTLSYTGQTLTGWQLTGGSLILPPNAAITASDLHAIDGDAVFTAVWTRDPYYVNFNSNGKAASDMPAALLNYYGDTPTLPLTEPTAPGFIFREWNTAADGSGTSYAPGDSITAWTNITQDQTLYAIWDASEVNLTLDVGLADIRTVFNDPTAAYNFVWGDGNTSQTRTYGPYAYNTDTGNTGLSSGQYTVKALVDDNYTNYSLTDWQASTWDTVFNGGHNYLPGGGYIMVSDTTLYPAAWSMINYNMTFDANGGSMTSNGTTSYTTTTSGTASVTYGGVHYNDRYQDYITTTPTATRPGYAFVCWRYTDPDTGATYDMGGGSAPPQSDRYRVHGDATLYAVWEDLHRTLTFDPAGGTITASDGRGTAQQDGTLDYSIYTGQAYNAVMDYVPTATRPGYNFLRWEYIPAAFVLNNNNLGNSYSLSTDGVFTAIWERANVNITLTNTVVDPNDDPANTHFRYTVTVTDGGNTTTTAYTVDNGGSQVISVPVGASVEIRQDDHSSAGFSTRYVAGSAASVNSLVYTHTVAATDTDFTVAYHNERTQIAPTGLGLMSTPFILVILIVAPPVAMQLYVRRREDEEEETPKKRARRSPREI